MAAARKLSGAQRALKSPDESDAKRIVECATLLAGLPVIASLEAREMAVVQLRRLRDLHPQFSGFYTQMIQHVENCK